MTLVRERGEVRVARIVFLGGTGEVGIAGGPTVHIYFLLLPSREGLPWRYAGWVGSFFLCQRWTIDVGVSHTTAWFVNTGILDRAEWK